MYLLFHESQVNHFDKYLILDKNLFLKFYGANKNTVLYIDGKKVGEHVGGFSAFIFDITEYVKNDTIKIKVETVNIDTASIPVNSDFTHWAGLYRDVELYFYRR